MIFFNFPHSVWLFKIFERLRHENPANLSKIKLISGDMMEVGLGISKKDRDLLTNKIDVVFHSAATIKFTEPLRFALDMNTMGTRKIVQLCNEMKELKVSGNLTIPSSTWWFSLFALFCAAGLRACIDCLLQLHSQGHPRKSVPSTNESRCSG